MNHRRSPRVALISFTFILLLTLIGSLTLETSAAAKKGRGGKSAGRSRGAAKRGGRASGRESARSRRGGGRRMSKRELRAANARSAKERSAYIAKLQKRYFFYMWDEAQSMVRWMCSWDTTEADVKQFVDFLRRNL